MGFLSWIVFGLIAGALAKWIMPGKSSGGMVSNILVGIGGAMVGGFVASSIGLGTVTVFDLGSLLIATGGAVLLLFVVGKVRD